MGDLDALKFEIQDEALGGTKIKVVGVGGGGSNAVGRMVTAGVQGVEFHVMNTDAQALRASPVTNRLALGSRITHGLGAGSDPEIGRQAALEDTDRIIEILEGADMVFVAAGLGGGTGTGAAPVIASLAKELNALTVAVVTKPFSFEGPRRMNQAQKGLAELAATVDTVISIPNDRLVDLVPAGTSFFEAFRLADDVLRQGVQGISDIITTPGLINRDFADVRAIMVGMGFAMMGTAVAGGENAAVAAAKEAIQCPLLEEGGLQGARAILLNITASSRLSIQQMRDACELIRESTGYPDVQINFGLVPDESMGDNVKVTVIATGFQRQNLPEVESRPAISVSESRQRRAAPVSIPRDVDTAVPTRVATPQPLFEQPEEIRTPPTVQPAPSPVRVSAVPPPTAVTAAPDIELEPEYEPASAAPAVPEAPASKPPVDDDAFELEDIETPAFLRRERRLFQ